MCEMCSNQEKNNHLRKSGYNRPPKQEKRAILLKLSEKKRRRLKVTHIFYRDVSLNKLFITEIQ